MSVKELNNPEVSSMETNQDQGFNHMTNSEIPVQIPEDILAKGLTRDPGKVGMVYLHGQQIVSLTMEGKERLCLAQISNTLLKNFSYNEIHNRRVALGITCVQCTPVQLEILRKAGAMPSSSRRCGMITKREAERLVHSFLDEVVPPKLPDDFVFRVEHDCGWGCKGAFVPSRYNSSRAKCIRCHLCGIYFSPNKFIFHFHRSTQTKYNHPDAANFNSWRRHLKLSDERKQRELVLNAWEDVKAMFNGGNRRRMHSSQRTHIHTHAQQRSTQPLIFEETPHEPVEELKCSFSYSERRQLEKDAQYHQQQQHPQEGTNSPAMNPGSDDLPRYSHSFQSENSLPIAQSPYKQEAAVRFTQYASPVLLPQNKLDRGSSTMRASPCLARSYFLPDVSASLSNVVCSLLPTGQSQTATPLTRNLKELSAFPGLLSSKSQMEYSFSFPFNLSPGSLSSCYHYHQSLMQPHPFFPKPKLDVGYPRYDASLWQGSKFKPIHCAPMDTFENEQSVLELSKDQNTAGRKFLEMNQALDRDDQAERFRVIEESSSASPVFAGSKFKDATDFEFFSKHSNDPLGKPLELSRQESHFHSSKQPGFSSFLNDNVVTDVSRSNGRDSQNCSQEFFSDVLVPPDSGLPSNIFSTEMKTSDKQLPANSLLTCPEYMPTFFSGVSYAENKPNDNSHNYIDYNNYDVANNNNNNSKCLRQTFFGTEVSRKPLRVESRSDKKSEPWGIPKCQSLLSNQEKTKDSLPRKDFSLASILRTDHPPHSARNRSTVSIKSETADDSYATIESSWKLHEKDTEKPDSRNSRSEIETENESSDNPLTT